MYVKEIKTLKDLEDRFDETTQVYQYGGYSTIRNIMDVFFRTPDTLRMTPKFADLYAQYFTGALKRNLEKGWAWYPRQIVRALNMVNTYLPQKHKNEIIDTLLSPKTFFNEDKGTFMSWLIDNIEPNSEQAPKMFERFYRTLKDSEYTSLLDKIENGNNNPRVQAIFQKSKLLEHLSWSEEDFKNDPVKRKKIIRAIAKTPTITKRIKFDLDLTKDDISQLAPVMKFNFLQFVLSAELECGWNYSYKGWFYNEVGPALEARIELRRMVLKLDRVKVPRFTIKELRELLFSVSLRKNDQLNKFLRQYKSYLVLVEAKNRPPTDYIRSLLQGEAELQE